MVDKLISTLAMTHTQWKFMPHNNTVKLLISLQINLIEIDTSKFIHIMATFSLIILIYE